MFKGALIVCAAIAGTTFLSKLITPADVGRGISKVGEHVTGVGGGLKEFGNAVATREEAEKEAAAMRIASALSKPLQRQTGELMVAMRENTLALIVSNSALRDDLMTAGSMSSAQLSEQLERLDRHLRTISSPGAQRYMLVPMNGPRK